MDSSFLTQENLKFLFLWNLATQKTEGNFTQLPKFAMETWGYSQPLPKPVSHCNLQVWGLEQWFSTGVGGMERLETWLSESDTNLCFEREIKTYIDKPLPRWFWCPFSTHSKLQPLFYSQPGLKYAALKPWEEKTLLRRFFIFLL